MFSAELGHLSYPLHIEKCIVTRKSAEQNPMKKADP
jgi:hypothetical protein